MTEKIFDWGRGQVYLASNEKCTDKWVMGVHGSGRDALSYRDVEFYAYQRDLAIRNGCDFVSISMGQDVWARDDGLARLEELHDWMTKQHYDKKCVIIASSAGGCQMFRFAQVYPEYTAALIGIFPVWDVQSIHLPSLKQAWALDDISLNSALNSRNPANRPDEIPDVPIVICHGLTDKAVPIADHALKLAQKVPVSIHVTRDGHSTEAFDLYRTPLLVDVINDYVGL